MPKSFISNEEVNEFEIVNASDIRKEIFQLIQNDYPAFSNDSLISIYELNQYRRKYITTLIQNEDGELEQIDQDVMKAINNNEILADNIEPELDSQLSFAQKLADRIATFGGSWTFILSFFSFLILWMALNVVYFLNKGFDPYPFILLNLILSCLAAIQAPIIMMSQNRQEEKDRIRAEHDYKINLKAELEIKLLHEKIDHLLVHQNKRLLEIQEMQIDYLEELISKRSNSK